MSPEVISVQEFLKIVNETLAVAFPEVTVEGEVSEFKVWQNKFVYFSLKEGDAVMNCFMMAFHLKLPLEDGMKIRATGIPKIVTKQSKFSLTVRQIDLAGEGELRRAMELLKKKLDSEGLFDPARKRTLPTFPERIGLITSGTSAAYADFIKILNTRWSNLQVLLADVTVQGSGAPEQITGAIDYFNRLPDPVDILVIIRGGGSLEDLIAFSTEPVARAVATSRTPTIVGVGHEIDFSLADYAADVRAATPTDAARIVVPDRREVLARIEHLNQRLDTSLKHSIETWRASINQSLSKLENYLRTPQQRLEITQSSLRRGLGMLSAAANLKSARTTELEHTITTAQRTLTDRARQQTLSLIRILKGFDPQATLARGYAIVHSKGRILKSAASTISGAQLDIQLASGKLRAKVDDTPYDTKS